MSHGSSPWATCCGLLVSKHMNLANIFEIDILAVNKKYWEFKSFMIHFEWRLLFYTVPKNASVDPRIYSKCQCRGQVTWLKSKTNGQSGRSYEQSCKCGHFRCFKNVRLKVYSSELKTFHWPWTLEKVWDRPINDFSVEPANIWEFEEFFNIFSMIKPLIRSKILVHSRSYPFVSFHFPWNDDAMV